MADAADQSVQRIDPAANRIVGVTTLGGPPTALAATEKSIWVAVDSS